MRVLLGLALALIPAPAFAFVCSKACPVGVNPCPMLTQVWQQRCIPFSVNPNSDLLAGEEMHRLIAQSFAVWSANACTDLEFKDEGETTQLEHFSVREPAGDQRNVVAAVEERADLNAYFDDPGLLAVTLTHFSVGTGEILDADILFNAVGFHFEDVTDTVECRLSPSTFDLRNTLVHEIGHFIGFDHNTTDPTTTMFGMADTCEIMKRDLAADDQSGVCTVYPTGMTTRTCEPSPDYNSESAVDATPYRMQCDRKAQIDEGAGGCSCSTTEAGHCASGWSFAAVLAALFARRRRR